jgi:hypothetical protein
VPLKKAASGDRCVNSISRAIEYLIESRNEKNEKSVETESFSESADEYTP